METRNKNSALKIVTVDDSPIISERLKEMLAEITQVEYVGNASSIPFAMALIKKQKPHVVILDIHLEKDMPTANGINLLMMLRKQFADTKIIMLTNLTDPLYRNTCLFLGASYFFDKSNEFEKIPETLMEIIRSKNPH